jgi:hypothetical protein
MNIVSLLTDAHAWAALLSLSAALAKSAFPSRSCSA